MKRQSLADLQHIKQELVARAKAQAESRAQQQRIARQQVAQHNLFQAAIGAVRPLPPSQRANLQPAPPPALPRQSERDEAAAPQEALSDEFDVSSLLDSDTQLSFRRPGVSADVTHQLRRGKWNVQRQIDLHGLRSDDARSALAQFIRTAHQEGLRCIRIVHGKGHGSPGKVPVLKSKVQRWLVQKEEVIAFVQASPAHGGSGALLVLLQPLRATQANSLR